MELDDFKAQWAAHDRKLDQSIRLNTQLLFETRMGRAGASLRWAFRGILFEQLMSIPAIVLIGIFIGNHYAEPRYLVPAVVLDLLALASILSCAFQLEELHGIDFSEPVVAIQKKLERVRILRLRTIKWGLLMGPVVWIPFTIVVFRGVLGIDGYLLFRGNALAIDLAGGIVVIALLAWGASRVAKPLQSSRVGRWLLDELGGSSLKKATRVLRQLKELEQEGDRSDAEVNRAL